MCTVEKLNTIYSKTSNIFAEQQTKNTEEKANEFFDVLNTMKAEFHSVFIDYEDLIDIIAVSLASNKEKKELVVLREHLTPLYNLSRKLHRNFIIDPKLKTSFQSDLEQFKIYIDDLKEILGDIEKKLSSNPKIDQLLNEIGGW